MKALTVIKPGHAEFVDVKKPKAEENMVLVKVVRAGICATDYSIFSGNSSFVRDGSIKYPVRFGHEWSGVVEEIGEKVKGFKKGDRVVSDSGISCGKCEKCQNKEYAFCQNIRSVGTVNTWDGCFAEYILIPDFHLYHIPDNVSYDEAALIEPATVAYDAFRGANINSDTSVVVFGTGVIGMASVWLAKFLGAGKVIMVGRNDDKLKISKKVGADDVINNIKEDAISEIKRLTDGADMIIETSGSESALKESLYSAKRYGRISILSFYEKNISDLPIDHIVLQAYTISGGAGFCGYPQKICDIMEKYDVKLTPVITHRTKFEDCMEYFENEEKYRKEKIKIMLEF